MKRLGDDLDNLVEVISPNRGRGFARRRMPQILPQILSRATRAPKEDKSFEKKMADVEDSSWAIRSMEM